MNKKEGILFVFICFLVFIALLMMFVCSWVIYALKTTVSYVLGCLRIKRKKKIQAKSDLYVYLSSP